MHGQGKTHCSTRRLSILLCVIKISVFVFRDSSLGFVSPWNWREWPWFDSSFVDQCFSTCGSSVLSSFIYNMCWFPLISVSVCYSDKHIEAKCGPDAVYFLAFERSLIVVALFSTAFAMAFILPLNCFGSLHGGLQITVSDYSSNCLH